jgi:hypothetical protein
MSRTFPVDFLTEITQERHESPEKRAHMRDTRATGATFDDGLVEEWIVVFEHEGKFYEFKYLRGSDYYESEVGEDVDPFKYGQVGVECFEVFRREVTTITYERDA